MGFFGFLKKPPQTAAPPANASPGLSTPFPGTLPPRRDPLTPVDPAPEFREHDIFSEVPIDDETQFQSVEKDGAPVAPDPVPLRGEMTLEAPPAPLPPEEVEDEELPLPAADEELPDFTPAELALAREASDRLLEPKQPPLPPIEPVPRELLDHTPYIAAVDYGATLESLKALKSAIKRGDANLSKMNGSLMNNKQRFGGFAHALNNVQVQLLQADEILASTMR